MRLKHLLAGFAATCALLAQASAATYPSRPLRLIVPWPAGGLVDMPARLVAEKLQHSLGQSVIVENKPGAGGIIGTSELAKSPADGYTLMLTTSAMNMSAAIHSKLSFDVRKDFAPVAVAAYTSLILVTNPAKGPKSLRDLIALAKSKPGKLTYASAGVGTPGHFAGEMFKSKEGLDIVHVAYKGGPPAMVDQIAGLVDFHFANAAVALPQLHAGKIKALAVASMHRIPQLPDVPTMAEEGVPGFDMDQWIGFLAPAGTPAAIVDRLNAAIVQALQDKKLQADLERSGMVVAKPESAAQFKQYLRKDYDKWVQVARSAHIHLD
jgi:tripartite-type tricarboxylate transporter receptor subunit TctC